MCDDCYNILFRNLIAIYKYYRNILLIQQNS